MKNDIEGNPDAMPETTATLPTPTEAAAPDSLADLRHDLRNPIGQILGYSEMLIEEAMDTGQPVSPDLERIESAGRELLRLIDERLTPALLTGERAAQNSAKNLPAPLPESDYADRAGPAITDPELTGIVLMVDNSEENRDVIGRRLIRLGHYVVPAADGASALALLEEHVFDLVLLDVQMPGIDGIEVLRRIKADERLRHIPVIMISAVDEMASVAHCIEMGAEDYLPKPCDPILLRARVSASLRGKRAHDREARLASQIAENYEKLKDAERMRDDLTGMIVHDLRTPLTSILSGLQTLEILGEFTDEQTEMLTISLDGAQTLLGMINDLLDISKLEDGSLKLEKTTLQPADLVERARRQVALLARERGLHLDEEFSPNLPSFSGDEDKLRRTLVNLVGNALKFTPNGGTVTIGARVESDEMVFYVRDTGEGIPKESFGRIFEKFGQVESRKAGRKMSTGLGLTFCKMAVEAHGGRIWVESELGIGSTFLFALPMS